MDNNDTRVDGNIIIGSDHAGFALKEAIKIFLSASFPHLELVDVGTNSAEAVDYPDFGAKVAEAVSSGGAKRGILRGILICGSGIGMSIVANRYPRIRAGLCLDEESAILSRQHNDANILVLAGRKTSITLAEAIVSAWLKTDFAGGRHQTRILKIDKISPPGGIA
ncbi:MAG: ribose 5-phosphate isomerase B [Deltaproteobacteria bacterium]|nr:ribose 5-phosphate isomerase B [Deltaproteobacteria bacterium]